MRSGMRLRYASTRSSRGGVMCIRCGRRVGIPIRSGTPSALPRRSVSTPSSCSTSPTPTTPRRASVMKVTTSKPSARQRHGRARPPPTHRRQPRWAHEWHMRQATRRAARLHVPLVGARPRIWRGRRDGGGGGACCAGGVWGRGCGVGASVDAAASGVPGRAVCVEVGRVLHAGACRAARAAVGESAGAGVSAGGRVRKRRNGICGQVGIGRRVGGRARCGGGGRRECSTAHRDD